jgi:hypothetical protein
LLTSTGTTELVIRAFTGLVVGLTTVTFCTGAAWTVTAGTNATSKPSDEKQLAMASSIPRVMTFLPLLLFTVLATERLSTLLKRRTAPKPIIGIEEFPVARVNHAGTASMSRPGGRVSDRDLGDRMVSTTIMGRIVAQAASCEGLLN